ncbi:MAG: hypothetical protein QOI58_1162 [Thermoanaerobaculia bacterium]|jgi:hypothetical protein|nr:hypothetical protein [Thermoanaerobaculia bacterium]
MAETPSATPTAATPMDAIFLAIVDLLKTGSSPDILEAQRILLQRVALEGDVVPSRIPAPKNITEVGGYLNLLQDTGQPELRAEMLAALLGVAGPPQPDLLGPAGSVTPLAFVQLPNDRPAGTAQPAIPTTITIRSDFFDAFLTARKAIHDAGAMLPLLSPPRVLPRNQLGAAPPDDVLPLLGRALDVVPAALLVDPDNDSLAIARLASDPPGAFQLVTRELDGGTVVPEQSWSAQKCDDTTCTALPAAPHRYFPLAPILAAAGWYAQTPLVLPSSRTKPGSLSRLINIAGFVAGTTHLGDELALLYPSAQIAASTLVTRLHWVWNGQGFAEGA